jgi:hypothetical protein
MTALRFASLMATPAGRIVRALAGFALIALGFVTGGPLGVAIGLVGLVPVAAGVFNICFIAPLLNVPLQGSRLRELKAH